MRRLLPAIIAAALLFAGQGAQAVQPDEMLDDPALEQRARTISEGLRCLVCQNQSIDDSDAPLARDLRILVRDRLKAGDTNEEVVDFIVARYGEFVLLRPRFAAHTLVLWLTPVALLLIGATLAAFVFRRRRAASPEPLSEEERRRLEKLLDARE